MTGSEKFLVICITAPEFEENESEKLTSILASNQADILHIRKPGASYNDTERLIRSISPEFYNRIKIHDHFDLALKYGLRGVHLNSRNPVAPGNIQNVSKSVHSLEEINDSGCYEYITLSPIFDSISKPGYRAAFREDDLKSAVKGKKVIALGGVTPEKFEKLREIGFMGAAMSGYFKN